jgi:hypothetical protein
MSETEWLASTDPGPMLNIAQRANRRRTVRLFACACCRRLWELLPNESRVSVEVAERFACGLTPRSELDAALARANAAVLALPNIWSFEVVRLRNATSAAAECSSHLAETAAGALAIASNAAHAAALDTAVSAPKIDFSRVRDVVFRAERAAQAALVRELFGNPHRPVTVPRDWCTNTVMTLARTMNESREYGALPILADALQDAGCDSVELLDHCRIAEPHTFGCWAIDLVLDCVRTEELHAANT